MKPPSSLSLATPQGGRPPLARQSRFQGGKLGQCRGFTLVELMVTIAVAAILAGVALPSYQSHVVRTRRAAAAVCLTEQSQFLERVYAASNSYADNGGTATVLPDTPCRADIASSYTLAFASGQPQARTFVITATPQGVQADKDSACGTLSLNQAGVKSVSGTNTVAQCWR